MFLSDIFDGLTYGEASQLHIGGLSNNIIADENHAQLINAVNLGVLEIYKRFDIKIGTFNIQHILNTTSYPIPVTDLLVLLSATDEYLNPYAINDPNADQLNTFSINCFDNANLLIPFVPRLVTNTISFQYRALPEKINPDTAIPETQVVPVPEQFLEPILNYVAYRIFSGQNSTSPDTVNYYSKFETSLRLMENAGTYHKQVGNSNRLQQSGWV